MTPRDGVARIRLDADASRCAAAVDVGVVKARGLRALAAFWVGEKNRVVVALHHDLVFEPDAGDERGTGRVALNSRLIGIQVPDAVACLDLVNRPVRFLNRPLGSGLMP